MQNACAALANDALVIVPTDTVYGLAASANSTKAVTHLYALKNRAADKPFSLLVADLCMAERYGVFDDRAKALARSFWPGAMTMIVKARADAPLCPLLTTQDQTVGLRVPAHDQTRNLIAQFGGAVAAPSANLSGQNAPERFEQISPTIRHGAAMALDDGPCTLGTSSTLVDLRGQHARILRHGDVTQTAIMAVLQDLDAR